MKIKGVNIDRLRMLQFIMGSIFVSIIFVLAVSHNQAQAAGWKPDKNVEIVVPAGPGGGNDRLARTIQMIFQKKKMLEVTSTVVNKPGGSGTVAWAYINQHPKDGHYICTTSPVQLTSHISGSTSINYTDVTPLAQLFSEYIAFTVRADSAIKTGKDLIERLKKDPQSVTTVATQGITGAPHIAMALTAKKAGVDPKKLKVVVFSTGSEGTMALLGGHVDVLPTTPNNVLPLMKEGKVRLIGISSPKRLGGDLAGVPTWREQGVDAVIGNWRGIVGPQGMSQEQIAYWDIVLAKLNDSDEWTKESEKGLWGKDYMDSKESKKFLDAEYNELKELLTALGMVK